MKIRKSLAVFSVVVLLLCSMAAPISAATVPTAVGSFIGKEETGGNGYVAQSDGDGACTADGVCF